MANHLGHFRHNDDDHEEEEDEDEEVIPLEESHEDALAKRPNMNGYPNALAVHELLEASVDSLLSDVTGGQPETSTAILFVQDYFSTGFPNEDEDDLTDLLDLAKARYPTKRFLIVTYNPRSLNRLTPRDMLRVGGPHLPAPPP